MQDSAVTTRRVRAKVVLLVVHHDTRGRVTCEPGIRQGEPDDATADDGDVSTRIHSLSQASGWT